MHEHQPTSGRSTRAAPEAADIQCTPFIEGHKTTRNISGTLPGHLESRQAGTPSGLEKEEAAGHRPGLHPLGAVLPLAAPDLLAQRLDLRHLAAQPQARVQHLAHLLQGGARGSPRPWPTPASPAPCPAACAQRARAVHGRPGCPGARMLTSSSQTGAAGRQPQVRQAPERSHSARLRCHGLCCEGGVRGARGIHM